MAMRARSACTAVFAIALGSSTAGCVATDTPPPARGVVVTGPPPAPLVESPPPPPHPGAQFVAGYWHWTGVQYAWIPGHWESAPAGATWQAPRYSTTASGYVYEPGAWAGTGAKSAFR